MQHLNEIKFAPINYICTNLANIYHKRGIFEFFMKKRKNLLRIFLENGIIEFVVIK